MTTIQTERLILRPLCSDDWEPYAALCADPEVMRYIGTRQPLNREDAQRQLAMMIGHWTLRGFGLWAMEERATGRFIGRTGLYYPEGWPGPEVGWALARTYWGRGLAYEAAVAALDYAFGALQWPSAISLIDPRNSRSIRLAERLGERFEREIVVGDHPAHLYAIERSAWRAS